MSYILDALRKAERDRNLGRTPGLGEVTAHSARPVVPERSLRVWVLLGLVLGLILALWWVMGGPRTPASPAAETAAASPPMPVEPSAPAVPAPAAIPAEVAPAAPADPGLAAVDEQLAAESFDDLLEPPTVEPMQTEPPVTSSRAAPSGTTSSRVVTEPAAAALGEGDSGVSPELRDMPSDYRAGFPELRVDVHVYDADPARRWAMINGRKAMEGTDLPEGPRVVEITADGVIYDFRGRTTRVPINRGN